MPAICTSPGCKFLVPAEVESERLCAVHFIAAVDQACNDIRHETVMGETAPARREEILRYVAQHGEMLARLATGGARLPDAIKGRILNAFLALMNLRENLDRGAARKAAMPLGRASSESA